MTWGLHRKGEINYTPEKAESRHLKEQGSHSRQETAPPRADSLLIVSFISHKQDPSWPITY